jgi:hypothetical protein
VQNNLATLIESKRKQQQLSTIQLAVRLGYKNINKGCRRIEDLEKQGISSRAFLEAVSRELKIAPELVQEATSKDDENKQKRFEEWAAQPQPLRLFAKGPIPVQIPLPAGCVSECEAIIFAREFAQRRGIKVCLVLDRRQSLWIDPTGTTHQTEASPEKPNIPSFRAL